jgi:hypothetical protein
MGVVPLYPVSINVKTNFWNDKIFLDIRSRSSIQK